MFCCNYCRRQVFKNNTKYHEIYFIIKLSNTYEIKCLLFCLVETFVTQIFI